MISNTSSIPGDLLRVRLFFVSYVPLWMIYAARFAPKWWVVAGFSVVAFVALVDGWRIVRGARRRPSYMADLQVVESQGDAVSGYLATYLLPFLGGLPTSPGDVIATAFYLLVAMTIFVRSNLALINPTLAVLGWKVSKVQADGRPSVLLLSRSNVVAGNRVEVYRLFSDVLVAREGVAR